MNTKMTLTLEKEIIEQANKYTAAKGRILSEITENYFKHLINFKAENSDDQLSSRIKNLRGVMKVDSTFNCKKILNEEKNCWKLLKY